MIRVPFLSIFIFLFTALIFYPHQALGLTVDTDADGLSDSLEKAFQTDSLKTDTDGDGYSDGAEVHNGYNPLDPRPIKLSKRIEITLKEQRLRYYLSNVPLGEMRVSTGRRDLPTPKGDFRILNKSPRAWSRLAGLWMPYWMGIHTGKFGLHELPEWPGGKKEGAKSLGQAVSHGCIRLGVGDAKKLYDWTPIGTRVVIK